MACLDANVAVPRESATLILLWPTRATLVLETGALLAFLLRLLPASTLALALAWLVPSFLLAATWLARETVVTALLALISMHERQDMALSN